MPTDRAQQLADEAHQIEPAETDREMQLFEIIERLAALSQGAANRDDLAGAPQAGEAAGDLTALCDRMGAVTREYIDRYEYDDGESAPHQPDEMESALIADAIHGLMADENWQEAYFAWDTVRRAKAEATQPAPSRDSTTEPSACCARPCWKDENCAPECSASSNSGAEQKLRRMLCVAYAGALAYMDDGEAQDNREFPAIDFLRDPIDIIESKMRSRVSLGYNSGAEGQQAAPETFIQRWSRAIKEMPTHDVVGQQAARSEAPALTDEMIDAAVEAFHARRGSGYREDWRIAIQAALAASPPEAQPAEQRKPLTEEQVSIALRQHFLVANSGRESPSAGTFRAGLRYAERAHGITEQRKPE